MVKEVGGVIPTIDLQESPFPYAKLREACEEWGCFRVLNHRVPTALMAEMKTVARSLLDLPAEMKNRHSTGRGYIPLGTVNSIYESLGFANPASSEAVESFCSNLEASSYQTQVFEKYSQAVDKLMDTILHKMVKSLKLPAKDPFTNWPRSIRLIKYTFTPKTIGSYGMVPHTDPGFLTLLQDDEVVGGLEVADKSGPFVMVKSSPGNFIVFIGDVASVWSNGRFAGGKHRVKGTEASVRVSIGSIMRGPKDSVVEAPDELVDSNHPRLYAPMHYGEYLNLRDTDNMHDGEALALLRL